MKSLKVFITASFVTLNFNIFADVAVQSRGFDKFTINQVEEIQVVKAQDACTKKKIYLGFIPVQKSVDCYGLLLKNVTVNEDTKIIPNVFLIAASDNLEESTLLAKLLDGKIKNKDGDFELRENEVAATGISMLEASSKEIDLSDLTNYSSDKGIKVKLGGIKLQYVNTIGPALYTTTTLGVLFKD